MAFRSSNRQKDFPALLHLTFKLQHITDELLLSEVGVGLSQIRIMSVLNSTLPRSQRAVAGQLSQTEANVSRQLKVMQKRGLVSVKKNKKDARARDVSLTGKGQKKYDQAVGIVTAQNDKWLKLLSKNELKAFLNATQSLNRL